MPESCFWLCCSVLAHFCDGVILVALSGMLCSGSRSLHAVASTVYSWRLLVSALQSHFATTEPHMAQAAQ